MEVQKKSKQGSTSFCKRMESFVSTSINVLSGCPWDVQKRLTYLKWTSVGLPFVHWVYFWYNSIHQIKFLGTSQKFYQFESPLEAILKWRQWVREEGYLKLMMKSDNGREGDIHQRSDATKKKYRKFLNYYNKHGANKRPCSVKPSVLLEDINNFVF